MDEVKLPMEPIVLIDKSKNKEVHIVSVTNNTLEDVIQSAKRLSTGLFEGDWNLSIINPQTKEPEPVQTWQIIADFIDKDIDTFYWNYVKPAFKITIGTDSKNANHRREVYTDYRTQSESQSARNAETVAESAAAAPASGGKGPRIFEYADAGKRMAAFIIDWVILLVLLSLLGMKSYSFIIWWLYFALMESSESQATLGKMLMGLKVTDLRGKRLSFGKATGRYFAKLLSWMTLMIGFLMAFFTEKRQALHDLISGCVVIESK